MIAGPYGKPALPPGALPPGALPGTPGIAPPGIAPPGVVPTGKAPIGMPTGGPSWRNPIGYGATSAMPAVRNLINDHPLFGGGFTQRYDNPMNVPHFGGMVAGVPRTGTGGMK